MKSNKKKKPKIKQTMWEIIPVWNYDKNYDCFVTADNQYMGLLQIRTKDLINSSEEEIEYDILKMAKLYKVTNCDLKIISMNFPCNTEKQRNYLKGVMDRTRNPLFLQELERKYEELENNEKQNSSHEYFLCFFCDDIEEFVKTRIRIIQSLKQGKKENIFEIPFEKKQQILYKMSNKMRIS